MTTPAPLSTRPPSKREAILQTKFYEHLTVQSDLLDKIAGQLLTVELTVPSLFVAALKLVRGEEATVPLSPAPLATFALWLLAVILTLLALLPRKWKVDPNLLRQAAGLQERVLGIEDFFERVAAYKYRLLWAASLAFLAGVMCALFI